MFHVVPDKYSHLSDLGHSEALDDSLGSDGNLPDLLLGHSIPRAAPEEEATFRHNKEPSLHVFVGGARKNDVDANQEIQPSQTQKKIKEEQAVEGEFSFDAKQFEEELLKEQEEVEKGQARDNGGHEKMEKATSLQLKSLLFVGSFEDRSLVAVEFRVSGALNFQGLVFQQRIQTGKKLWSYTPPFERGFATELYAVKSKVGGSFLAGGVRTLATCHEDGSLRGVEPKVPSA